MSNEVQQIRSAMLSSISTELGSSFSELKYSFDLAKNSFRTNDKKYGVLPLGADQNIGPLKTLTFDQTFQVIISQGYINRTDDSDQVAKMLDNFDKMNEISNQFQNDKLGLPSVVLVVETINYEEPEEILENDVMALRANFLVKYRFAI